MRLALVTLALIACGCASTQVPEQRPHNVVVIVIDDVGPDYT